MYYVYFAAIVEIVPLDSDIISEVNIDCPGDILSYNCSIQSNSEAVYLTWRVTLPGESPISVTIYPSDNSTGARLNDYITATLTGFRNNEFIHSTIEFTVHPDIPTDQIIVECSIDDLGNDTITLYIQKASKSYSNSQYAL